MKKDFIKKWQLISLIVLVFFVLSGVGLFLAYKNGKFARAQNPVPTPSATNIADPDRPIIKTVSPSNLNMGEAFNINLQIPGMEDGSNESVSADVMLVIDFSESMDRPGGGDCSITNPVTGESITRINNRRLCFAKNAAVKFMDKAAAKNIRVGFQLFADYNTTYDGHFVNGTFDNITFAGLTDVKNDNVRKELKAKMIGYNGVNNQFKTGSAMGMGISKAVKELAAHGNLNSNKYIVILSDGDENLVPLTAACSTDDLMSKSIWPNGWPGNSSLCSTRRAGSDSGYFDWAKINAKIDQTTRIYGREHPTAQIITPEMMTADYTVPLLGVYHFNQRQAFLDYCAANNRSPCAFSPQELDACVNGDPGLCPICHLGTGLSCKSAGFYFYEPWFEGSPADEAIKNNVKIISVGYFQNSDNSNGPLLEAISKYTYNPDGSGYWHNIESSGLNSIMEQIIDNLISQRGGAPLTVIETLPLGAIVSASDISLVRDGVVINAVPVIATDGLGRQTITIEIGSGNYSSQTDPGGQTFEVRIKNIRGLAAGCFDADQNCDLNGNIFPEDQRPSKVTWTFPLSGNPSITKYMPCWKGCVTSQYTGDVYGASIGEYLFSGIDLTVSGDNQNLSSQAVWSLADYKFQSGSASNFEQFKIEMNKTTAELMKRAEVLDASQITHVFSDPDPNANLYPDGKVYRINGAVNLDSTILNINKRATVIINGNLNTSAEEIKKGSNNDNNNILFLVINGHNVNLTGGVRGLELAIVAPEGVITVADTNTSFKLKGLLVANDVRLRANSNNALKQNINYDPSLTLYPPPGLSSILSPIFNEAKP